MKLKAGTVADFAGSLAQAMDKAMNDEWLAVKGVSLPTQGQDDRRLLFAAIAQGLFVFLKAHEDELMNNITIKDGGIGLPKNYGVTQLELNL
jgi:hypothetical protein